MQQLSFTRRTQTQRARLSPRSPVEQLDQVLLSSSSMMVLRSRPALMTSTKSVKFHVQEIACWVVLQVVLALVPYVLWAQVRPCISGDGLRDNVLFIPRCIRCLKLGTRNLRDHLSWNMVRHNILLSIAHMFYSYFFVIREICQRSLTQERLKVQHVIEQMPKRFVKPADDSTESSPKWILTWF